MMFDTNFGSPKNMGYFSDWRHDHLRRCKICKLKYDLIKLHIDKNGTFVCKFCLSNGEVENVYTF